AIALARKDEVNDFIKAEAYLENSPYFQDIKIEQLNEINESLISLATTIGNSSELDKEIHIKEIIKARAALINFSVGNASSLDLNSSLSELRNYLVDVESRAPAASALFWSGIVAASIPIIQFGYNVKRYVELDNRINEVKDFINNGTENIRKYHRLNAKLDSLKSKSLLSLVFSGGETLGKIYKFSLTGRASIITDNMKKIRDIGLENLKDLVEEMNKDENLEEFNKILEEL
ncbi:MAG: hypothetical protein ACO20H_13730, partial [Bacteriovoracaceae bacterium]